MLNPDDIDPTTQEGVDKASRFAFWMGIIVSAVQSLLFLLLGWLVHDVRFAAAAVIAPVFLWIPLFLVAETWLFLARRLHHSRAHIIGQGVVFCICGRQQAMGPPEGLTSDEAAALGWLRVADGWLCPICVANKQLEARDP